MTLTGKIAAHRWAPSCIREKFLFQTRRGRARPPSSSGDLFLLLQLLTFTSVQDSRARRCPHGIAGGSKVLRNPWIMGEDWQCWHEDPPLWMWRLEREWPCWKLSPKTSTEWFNPKSHWQVPGKAQKKFRSESKLYNLRFKSSLGCRIKFPTVPGKGRNCVGSICGISASLSLK